MRRRATRGEATALMEGGVGVAMAAMEGTAVPVRWPGVAACPRRTASGADGLIPGRPCVADVGHLGSPPSPPEPTAAACDRPGLFAFLSEIKDTVTSPASQACRAVLLPPCAHGAGHNWGGVL